MMAAQARRHNRLFSPFPRRHYWRAAKTLHDLPPHATIPLVTAGRSPLIFNFRAREIEDGRYRLPLLMLYLAIRAHFGQFLAAIFHALTT